MEKQRKAVKQDKIIVSESLNKVTDLQFLLKGYRKYSEPYPVSCLVDPETLTGWKKLTT